MTVPPIYRCDICLTSGPAGQFWTYEIAPVSIEPPVTNWARKFQDDGAWAICQRCRPDVEAGDIETLTARSMAHDPKRADLERSGEAGIYLEFKRRIITGFLQSSRYSVYFGFRGYVDGETQNRSVNTYLRRY